MTIKKAFKSIRGEKYGEHNRSAWYILTTSIASFTLLTLIGCEEAGIGSDWRRLEPKAVAPAFTLSQLNGSPVSLADYRGRIVILEFWATWCGPCRSSLPSLEVISRQYRDRGVSVLLINEQETAERVRQWAGDRFTAPSLLDQDGRVGEQYQLRGLPRLFMLDQAGRVVYAHEGYGGWLERNLKLILGGLLAQPSSSPPHG